MKVKRPERPVDSVDWRRQMNVRLPTEFIAGAEEELRRRTGRTMTAEELERALRRYPGDLRAPAISRSVSPRLNLHDALMVSVRCRRAGDFVAGRTIDSGTTGSGQGLG